MTENRDNECVILTQRPDGVPNPNNFAFEVRSLGPRAAGMIRCQTLFLSLDPYIRSVIAGNHLGHGIDTGDIVPGEVVARIIESDDQNWPVGMLVRCHSGWQQFCDQPAEGLSQVPQALSRPSLTLSILGMPGLTAWAGMVSIANVKRAMWW